MKHDRVLNIIIYQRGYGNQPISFKILVPEDLAKALTDAKVLRSEFILEDHKIIERGVTLNGKN